MKEVLKQFGHSARWSEFGELRFEELILSKSITYTFVFYLLGSLYLVAPLVGWALIVIVFLRWSLNQPLVNVQNSYWVVWVWVACALMLELALIVGHIDFDLGFAKVVKSTIGWAKGWALLSVFVVLGYCFDIRYQLICRAACVIGLAALLLSPLLVVSYLIGLPDHLYVSPLKILGGAGDEFFSVMLYEIDSSNGSPRWRFFAPWAPAVGLVANIYFLCAWFEKNAKWRVIGLLGNALMVAMAASRMGMIVMLLVPLGVWGLSRLTRPWVMVFTSVLLLISVLFYEPIFYAFTDLLNEIKDARADSTRVREALANIAIYRWQSEAYWFGHGVVETGSHLVEFMPIGSHHNWYGLLFVKGMIGFLSFFIPFLVTSCVLLVKAQYQVSSRLGLGVCLIVWFFSLSENVEALAYMTWPAWLLIGIGLRSELRDIDTNEANLLGQLRLRTSFSAAKVRSKV